MFIGGCLHIQWQVVHRLAVERFVAIAVIAVWLLVGGSLPGWAAVAGIAAILAAMQSITWRRFRSGERPRRRRFTLDSSSRLRAIRNSNRS